MNRYDSMRIYTFYWQVQNLFLLKFIKADNFVESTSHGPQFVVLCIFCICLRGET